MSFAYDLNTNNITMPVGDTGGFMVKVNWDRLAEGDVVLFAIFGSDGDLLNKPVEIVDGKAYVRLCNHDTRDIEPGRYNWNLRIVTSPARDENGNVIADECSDDVVTVFDKPPRINLTRGGARV